jgi:hypothetical protein
MNTSNQFPRIVALVLLITVVLVLASGAAPLPERTGTYDSRVVAFAAFWDESNQARLNALIREAHDAKEQGNFSRYESLAKQLSGRQHELHMQVFGTAPIDDVIAGLQGRLPALMREAGVSRLVSKWDTRALARVPATDCVDVTDLLVREFRVPEAKLKQLEQLKAATPVSPERAAES